MRFKFQLLLSSLPGYQCTCPTLRYHAVVDYALLVGIKPVPQRDWSSTVDNISLIVGQDAVLSSAVRCS